MVSMTDINPVHRLDAKEAKDRLGTIVNSLLVKPDSDIDRKYQAPLIRRYYKIQWKTLTTQAGLVVLSGSGICEDTVFSCASAANHYPGHHLSCIYYLQPGPQMTTMTSHLRVMT